MTIFILIFVGCVGTFLFTMLWLLSNDKITKEDSFSEEERKIEDEKKKQQYEEISDIWEYGEKAMLAVVPSQSDETRGTIHYVELKCTNIDSTPWIITISNSDGLSEEFKATRKGNTFIGLKDEKIAIMKKGQLIIDDKIFYFSTFLILSTVPARAFQFSFNAERTSFPLSVSL